MSNAAAGLPAKHLRATDTNSLLRLYDRMNDLHRRTQSLQDRAQLTKTIERITQELQKRHVPLKGVPA